MINRAPLLTIFMLFIATVYGLFCIKEKVVLLKSELSEVKRQIKLERDSIHILRAEFAYLSAPERLAKLNDNYLQLTTTDTKQIVADLGEDIIADIDNNQKSARKMFASNNSVSKIKWRFKKGPDKYITRVSGNAASAAGQRSRHSSSARAGAN